MLSINDTPISRDSLYKAQELIWDIHPGLIKDIIIDTSAPYREELQDSVSNEIRKYVSWAVISIRTLSGEREIIGIHTMKHPIIIMKLLIFLEQFQNVVKSNTLDTTLKQLIHSYRWESIIESSDDITLKNFEQKISLGAIENEDIVQHAMAGLFERLSAVRPEEEIEAFLDNKDVSESTQIQQETIKDACHVLISSLELQTHYSKSDYTHVITQYLESLDGLSQKQKMQILHLVYSNR